jgi:hypothetical protein
VAIFLTFGFPFDNRLVIKKLAVQCFELHDLYVRCSDMPVIYDLLFNWMWHCQVVCVWVRACVKEIAHVPNNIIFHTQ